MSVKFYTIVCLSDKTAIEYETFATDKVNANKSVLAYFGYRGIKSIKSQKV